MNAHSGSNYYTELPHSVHQCRGTDLLPRACLNNWPVVHQYGDHAGFFFKKKTAFTSVNTVPLNYILLRYYLSVKTVMVFHVLAIFIGTSDNT
jgi:hypothetical protein